MNTYELTITIGFDAAGEDAAERFAKKLERTISDYKNVRDVEIQSLEFIDGVDEEQDDY